MLKKKILELNEISKNRTTHTDVLATKDLLNQLLILYNAILNILQDIENSITFCKVKTLHPSIIKTSDLFIELRKISMYYKNQLPFELKIENILDFESVINVHCKIDSTQIIYFLSIPIDFETKFDLYYMLPIPTKYESEFATIIPDVKYFLKSKNNIIKPLNDICMKSKMFQCSFQLLTNHKALCEEQILLEGRSDCCQYTKLTINENHMEIVPEINQYLGVFPQEEIIKIKCYEETETKLLQGIFLLKEDKCQILFKNDELIYQSKSYGKPVIINNLPLILKKEQISNFSIDLKTLNLKKFAPNPAIPITHEEPIKFHIPSLWTVALYIGLAITACFIFYKSIKSKNHTPPNIKIKIEENSKDPKKIHLPEEACF